ncbi:hypothetical protein [Streptomyces sp. NPDC052701]|uniref:hypothetical protein n=1 Tax=Streptomyces sp. NPDC052701 TaxID=3155533 RepID=UPI0034346D70
MQAAADRETLLSTVFPAPLRFPGMAARRYREFEDARVDLGGVEAAPPDLARMLAAEFATVYGNEGRLLDPGLPTPHDLFAEEVPREGVTRTHQYARAVDGRGLLWTTRRARPGRGESSSGLRFDHLEEQGCRSAAQPGRLPAAPARRHGE